MPDKFGWNQLRYKNPFEKGIYWYYLSLEVRKRDIERWGTCISCDRPITMENAQGGHFCPAGSCGRDLLFDLLNINAECHGCNGFDSGHLFGYERNLDIRYGKGTAQALKDRYLEYKKSDVALKDWSAKDYATKIKSLSSYAH